MIYILMSHKTIQTSVWGSTILDQRSGCYSFDFHSKNGEQRIKKTQRIIHIIFFFLNKLPSTVVRPSFFFFFFK